MWASFGVLNVLRHYVARALGSIFSVLTITVASVNESCVSRAAVSTSETIASDRWINIRCSGLFSSVRLRVEI